MHTDSSTVKSGFKLEYLAAKNYGKDTLHLFFYLPPSLSLKICIDCRNAYPVLNDKYCF